MNETRFAAPFPARRVTPGEFVRPSLLLPVLLVSVLLASAASPARAIDYAESSTGLSTPGLDGGRTELEFADVNADGHVDIVSVGDHGNPGIGSGEHGIMVWFGDGAGSWSHSQYGEFGYGGIAVGDVNGDGHADVGYGMHHNYAAGDLGDQLLEVALGDGTGLFWTPWDDGLATAGESWGMFGCDFADLDNDGDLDLGSVSFGCCAGVHVYLNHGDGTWSQTFGFIGGNSHVEFEFGDVDADGNADFAVGQQMGTVYRGDGAGGFTLADDGLPVAGIIGRRGPDLADADGDGRDELSYVNDNGGVEVHRRDGSGVWQPFRAGLPGTGTYQITQFHDMDGDGLADVTAFGDGVITVWRGNGAGVWFPAASFTPGTGADAQALRVGGDADHNGFPDIAEVGEEGSFPSYRNYLRFYRETSAPSVLAARVVEPGGGETWVNGSVRFIDWAASVPGVADGAPAGAATTVRIDFSLSGAGGPWMPVADGLPDNGRYQWTVASPAPSEDCRLRVRVTGDADTVTAVSDPFRVVFPAGTSIAGGEWQTPAPHPATRGGALLLGLHPNPTEAGAWIHARLPAEIRIHDVTGRLVFVGTAGAAGATSPFLWDGRDRRGNAVPSGIYLVTARAGQLSETRRLVIAR